LSAALEDVGVTMSDTLRATRHRVAAQLAAQRVGEAVIFEKRTEEVVQKMAAERGWQVARNVTVDVGAGRTEADFVFETEYGNVLVETAAITRGGPALVLKSKQLAAAVEREHAFHAILVVPDGSVHGTLDSEVVKIVEVSGLEAELRELP
jgi:hypothetical protein